MTPKTASESAPPPKHSEVVYSLITLRGYFAGQVVASNTVLSPSSRPQVNDHGSIDTRAAWAREVYALADAMIAERGRR
jgi:hypothetical protein